MQANEQCSHTVWFKIIGAFSVFGHPPPTQTEEPGPQWLSHLPFSFLALSPRELAGSALALSRPLLLVNSPSCLYSPASGQKEISAPSSLVLYYSTSGSLVSNKSVP